jgi:hypothetical protein
MQHLDTFEGLARHHVEQRVREAAHEAQRRLAREANAAHRPNARPGVLQRLGRAVATAFVSGRRASTETAHPSVRHDATRPSCRPGCCVAGTSGASLRGFTPGCVG